VNRPAQVYFYLPAPELVKRVPKTIDDYWPWINDAIAKYPATLGRNNKNCLWAGPYNWTIQTYLYLSASGFPCDLTASIPEQGIIVVHTDMVRPSYKPKPAQFIVEMKPDRALGSAYTQYVIVQNRHDPIRNGLNRLIVNSAAVNYWPQPGLLPRDPGRGDRFENVCYMGNPEQFIEPEVLASQMQGLGLTLKLVPRKDWHDYRDVDAVVAVRGPEKSRPAAAKSAIYSVRRKPATKLYNAWRAGVPAILSPDVAFEDIRRSELDFLEARSIPEIVQVLRRLQADTALRQSMVRNGRVRGEEFTPEKIAQEWIGLLEHEIIPSYLGWTQSGLRRRSFFFCRRLARRFQPRLLS
jgi:hypothetical protein